MTLNENYFSPVSESVYAHCMVLPSQSLGNQLVIHTEKQGFPELNAVKLAIFGVKENRNDVDFQNEKLQFESVRKALYSLYPGAWSLSIADLGNIEPGASVSDTYFAVKEVVVGLLKENIIPIILGGSQDITYAVYRAYDAVKPMVNMVSIDKSFDFGNANESITNKSYLSKIVIEEPNNLFNFVNLGYQTYFNPQEEIDLIEKLFFEAFRLGEVTADLKKAEPALRDADLVSLDLSAIRSQDLGIDKHSTPNGFSSVDICSLSRYAGLSTNVSSFGLYEFSNTKQSKTTGMLVAQVIWYFIEGVQNRVVDFPKENVPFQKYIVLVEDESIVFYKSLKTNRWWMEMPKRDEVHNNTEKLSLMSCNEADYVMACNQELPESYFKAIQKALI